MKKDFSYEDLVKAAHGDERKLVTFILDVYTKHHNLCELHFFKRKDGTMEIYQTEAFKANYDPERLTEGK